MTNLEFINEEIERIKELLELDDVLCELSDNDYKFCNDRLQTLQQIKCELEAWEEKEKGIRVFKESKQDALCPICYSYINFDCLNDELKYAPKYCSKCGTKIIFTKEDVLKH